jgi:hypothetical protein
MCSVLPPPGVNPLAVKFIIYHTITGTSRTKLHFTDVTDALNMDLIKMNGKYCYKIQAQLE